MPIVADAAVALRLDLQKYRADWRTAEGDAQRAGGRISGALSPDRLAGAFRATGAAAGLMFSESVVLAGEFEDQLRTINTVAQLSEADLDAVGDQIQQLARDSGKGTADLTAAYYDLVSAGVPAEQAMSVLRNSATLATGALSTTGESVDLITSALNAYGMDASESALLTDIFALAVQNGKVTAAELASSIAQIAPIAASAGVEIEAVAAGYASLTAKGVPAAQASTQMRSAISALLTPNEKLNALQRQTGINFAELARDQGLSVALEELRKATEGNATALDALATVSAEDFPAALADAQEALGLTNSDLEKFQAIAGRDGVGAAMAELTKQVGAGDSAFAMSLGSVEAYSFALNSTGASFEDAQGSLAEFQGGVEGLALEQATEKMRSPAEAAARLTQNVLTFMQDVGGPFAGTVGPMLMTLNNLGPALGGLGGVLGAVAGQLATGAATLIPTIGGAFAAAGTAIGGAFTAAAGVVIAAWPLVLLALVVAAIALLLTNPEIREKALEIGRAIVKAIGDALGAVAKVLGDIARAVISGVAGFVGTVVRFILEIPGRVAGLAGALIGLWANAWLTILNALATAIGTAVGFIVAIPGRVAGFVGGLIGLAGQAAAGVVSAIANGVGRVVGFVLGIPGRVAGWIGGLIGGAAQAAGGFIGSIVGMAGDVVATILGLPGRIIGGLTSGFANMGRAAVDAFLGFIRGIPEAVGNIVGGIGDFIGGFIPSFQSGTMYAPEGLAYLHEGEIVVPPNMAEAVRGLMAGGAAGGGGRGPVTVQIINPEPERAGTSAGREMELLNAMGVFG